MMNNVTVWKTMMYVYEEPLSHFQYLSCNDIEQCYTRVLYLNRHFPKYFVKYGSTVNDILLLWENPKGLQKCLNNLRISVKIGDFL